MNLKKWWDKRSRNLVLMIVSQVLLTVFVGYWIQSQYEREKEQLSRTLNRHFFDARLYTSDQLFYQQFIQPVIDHEDSVSFNEIAFNEVIFTQDKKQQLYDSIRSTINDNQKELEQLQRYLLDSIPSEETRNNSQSLFSKVSSSLFAFGINANEVLRINPFRNRNDSEITLADQKRQNEMRLLTTVFLQKLLESERIEVDMKWVDNQVVPDNIDPEPFNLYWINRKTSERVVFFVFENYEFHLLEVLSPQIAFALILLSLTGFSLILTYKGYAKQLKLNELRNDFINNITHELKIPVATAKAALEALGKFGLSADEQTQTEYINMVGNEMDRLDRLTNRVLNHAKIENKQLNIIFEEVELNLFLEEIVKSSRVLFGDKHVTINFEKPINTIYSRIDRLHMEGAIKNLIENAVKYGGEEVVITIQVAQLDKQTNIIVSDNGPGIPGEYINKVFDKFFRVPKGDTHNVKGYGLGLSYVYLVVQLHEGKIDVRNHEGGGCKFTLSIPAK